MKSTIGTLYIALTLVFSSFHMNAQDQKYTLDQIVQQSLENNSTLKIQKKVVEEKQVKIEETQVKLLPTIVINADYSYNFNVANLSLPAGSLGFIEPNSFIPNTNLSFPLTEKNNFSTGVSFYQPITQLRKITATVKMDKVDKTMAEVQANRLSNNIALDIKKLYYAILAARKRMDAAEKKIEVAKIQLYDLQSALNSGKTIKLNEAGFKANLLKEQQELLKLKIKEKDLLSDLQIISGIDTSAIILEESNSESMSQLYNLESLKESGSKNNFNVQLSTLEEEKLKLAVKATNESLLPDLGIIAGYNYQRGNSLLPETNPYIGASFKWNIQDIFSTSKQVAQRKIQYEQVKENNLFVKKQTNSEIDKSYRKLNQSIELVDLAKITLDYRKNDFELEKNKKAAGLCLPLDVLKSEFLLTEAKADYYEAKLNYIINFEELNNLTNLKK